jgi:thioredoxin reductase (NADPH)
MRYDADVIVVGGGPAGMSAAVRCRWVKRYKAVACSSLLIENAELGGLAAWHGCLLTGPGWKIAADEIVGRLRHDLEALHIPVYRGRVVRIEADGDIKRVYTADGRVFRSLAVIVAAGIKVLTNEQAYLGRGLEITSMGYESVVEQVRTLLARRWDPRLVVVGSAKLANLMPLMHDLNCGGSEMCFVIEDECARQVAGVRYGRVSAYWGEGRLEGITIETPDGPQRLSCAGALLDFNSYELAPVRTCVVAAAGQAGAAFIPVDADMQTEIPGLLAAGDVTAGGYNCFSRAVAQGIAAGLSAYRHVHRMKFGTLPPLFAYRPTDFVLHRDFRELPLLARGLRPMALVPADMLRRTLDPAWHWLVERLDGQTSLATLAQEARTSYEAMQDNLMPLIERKLITVHAEVDP